MEIISSEELADRNLVQKALTDKDQKAYAQLIAKYWSPVFELLLKMSGDPSQAEDLTIEAFTKAFKHLDSYEPKFLFKSWLMKIARNHCIDHLRKKKVSTCSMEQKYETDPGFSAGESIASLQPGPDEVFIEKQKAMIVQELVGQLKPHYSQLIRMRFFDGMSYEEISLQTDLPLGTVKVRIFRAKELLCQILKASVDNI